MAKRKKKKNWLKNWLQKKKPKKKNWLKKKKKLAKNWLDREFSKKWRFSEKIPIFVKNFTCITHQKPKKKIGKIKKKKKLAKNWLTKKLCQKKNWQIPKKKKNWQKNWQRKISQKKKLAKQKKKKKLAKNWLANLANFPTSVHGALAWMSIARKVLTYSLGAWFEEGVIIPLSFLWSIYQKSYQRVQSF